MNATRMSGQSIIGLIIIIFGVLLLLSSLGIAGFGNVFKAVPSLFIAYGIWKLVSNGFNRPIWPILIIVVAAFVQLSVLGVGVGSLWPLILIIIGVAVMMGQRGFRGSDERASDDVDELNTLSVMGSAKRRLTTQAFRGGTVTAIMASAEIDLRGASTGDALVTLEVNAVLGEVKLRVSPHWSVNMDPLTIMGDVAEDRGAITGREENGPSLVVKGLVLMGSLKITD